MRLLLASPRGFCAGVERAITIVDRVLEKRGAPVYVRHELVHNREIVESFSARGVHFVDELEQIPQDILEGARTTPLVLSAHGVSTAVDQQGRALDMEMFDATCPLVSKVHQSVMRASDSGQDCVLVGHAGHPEVEGTLGRFNTAMGGQIYLIGTVTEALNLKVNQPQNVVWATQTTLSVDDTREIVETLKRRFPDIKGPKRADICYATQNRQEAVKQLALEADRVIVVGSVTSSNSNRLCELAQKCGVPARLLDDADQLELDWVLPKGAGVDWTVGITAGASTPEPQVERVICALTAMVPQREVKRQNMHGLQENVNFSIPPALRG